MRHAQRWGLMAVAGMLAFAPPVSAQTYPSKPLRILVPVAAGGLTDITARLIGQQLQEKLGQPVVVENRGGAAGIPATEAVARAPADGHTLLIAYPGVATVNPAMYDKLSYDPVKDFEPISLIASYPMVLAVHPSLPVRTVREFIDYVKARPGQLNYGSAGNGTTSHLAMELLRREAGLDLVHIPFKGAAPAMTELVAGRIVADIDSPPLVIAQSKAGTIRAIAVTSPQPSALMPGLPTVAEAVPGFDVTGWYGILAPAGTPKDVVARLSETLVAIMKLPDVRTRLAERGVEAIGTDPETLRVQIRTEIDKWGPIVKAANIKPD